MARRTLLGAAVAACWAAGAAAAVAPGTMAVTASSHAAGARDVRVAATLRYEMQCGYPGAAPVELTLPQSVPRDLAASAVLVNGKAATKVAVSGRTVTVTMPKRPQILCDSITTGRLALVLTRAARLANPTRPGAYAVTARKGALAFSARLVVTR